MSIAAAQQALAAGDPDGALRHLGTLSDPSALHFRAIVLRRAGRHAEARAAFERALGAAPGDPQLLNNFANLLRHIGEQQRALTLYDAALAAQPGYRDAAFNKSLLLAELGRIDDALAQLERLIAANPGDARLQSARGTMLREQMRHAEAADSYDRALALMPDLPTALKGRAQIALERGEADAVGHFQHAVAADGGDLGTIHGYAEALEAAGREDAAVMLEDVLAVRPDWIAGHQLLARMLAEQGVEDCTAAMRRALDARPGDRAFALALAGTQAQAGQWDRALAALPRDADLDGLRASYLVEAGQPQDALDLLRDAAGSEAQIARGRAYFRLGDPGAAVTALEAAVAGAPESITAWGLLELGWRLTGHSRSEWLSGQAGLVQAREVGLSGSELAGMADLLRRLHRTRAHPIGQSLRGGTQTRGRLFLRDDPLLARLRDGLLSAVHDYMRTLPALDDRHPLLKHRDSSVAIAGSWSVRLTDSGFHVNHIHPEGLLSSACYIGLPDGMGDADDRAGWLELGRPPPELGLPLEPLHMIEPRLGRLALFPSFLFHGTRPFGGGERLTVAFDVVTA